MRRCGASARAPHPFLPNEAVCSEHLKVART